MYRIQGVQTHTGRLSHHPGPKTEAVRAPDTGKHFPEPIPFCPWPATLAHPAPAEPSPRGLRLCFS